jgi:hypothetical protein
MVELKLDKIMQDISEIKQDIHIMKCPHCQVEMERYVDPSIPSSSSPSFDVVIPC